MKTSTLQPVKTLDELNNSILVRLATDKLALDHKINMLKDYQTVNETFINKFKELLPSIVEVLESLGLGIESMSHNKTGLDMKVWSPADSLKVNITAIPTSNKFKFIKDQGFTARGSGKNQPRLNAKAEEMQDVIKEKTGVSSVSVNPFSLEVDNVGDIGSVLIEMWIK